MSRKCAITGKSNDRQELVQLACSERARVDAIGDDPERQASLLDRFVFGERRQKALGGRHVERRRRKRHQHDVGAPHRIAQAFAMRAGRSVDNGPLRIEVLQILFLAVAVVADDRGKERRTALQPLRRRALRIGVGKHDALALAGEPAGDVGGERRLAAAAFRIGDHNRLHTGISPWSFESRDRPGDREYDEPGVQNGSLRL